MFAAAFAALLLALVHPLCTVTFSGIGAAHAATLSPDTGGTLPDGCCADANSGAPVKSTGLFTGLLTAGAPDAAAPIAWIRLPASRAVAIQRTTLAALPQLSYYVRSARILR